MSQKGFFEGFSGNPGVPESGGHGLRKSKTENFMKFYKLFFDQKINFLYKNRFLDLKKPGKTWGGGGALGAISKRCWAPGVPHSGCIRNAT